MELRRNGVTRAADASVWCVRATIGARTFVRTAMERPMVLWRSEHSSGFGPTLHMLAPRLGLPRPLVMPALSTVSFLAAGIVALFAYYSGADRHSPDVTPWDVAGAFALIWVGAGMLTEPEHVVQLFGYITMAQ
jgi:hypothetical protein